MGASLTELRPGNRPREDVRLWARQEVFFGVLSGRSDTIELHNVAICYAGFFLG